MPIDASSISQLLASLASRRPVFCSEMDFQLHLAWEMKERGWDLSLEHDPDCFDANAAIDILVHAPERVAIELKYKTSLLHCEIHGQPLRLKNQAAQPVSRHAFIKDIWRIETVVGDGKAKRGFAIFLSNDSGYWREGKVGTIDEMFSMFDGRVVGGAELRWGPKASAGTMKGREKAISLTREYTFGWKDYSTFDKKNGVFRYLLVEVIPMSDQMI
jgi:hypothetical protein